MAKTDKSTMGDEQPELISVETLKILIVIIGFFLPIAIVCFSIWIDARRELLPTLSEYYYTSAVSLYCGGLIAIAVLFMAYKGYEDHDWKYLPSDSCTANIGAIGIFVMAIFPSNTDCANIPGRQLPGIEGKLCNEFDKAINCAGDSIFGSLHYAGAAVALGVMALLCIFYFTQTGENAPTAAKLKRNKIYRSNGFLIILCMLLCLVPYFKNNGYIIYLEILAMWLFSFAWAVKTDLFKVKFDDYIDQRLAPKA